MPKWSISHHILTLHLLLSACQAAMMSSLSLISIEEQLRNTTIDYSQEDWKTNKDALSRIRALTIEPRRDIESVPQPGPQVAPMKQPVKSLPDMLALPINGQASKEPAEPILEIIQSEADISKHCDSEKMSPKATTVAKAIFRSLCRPESLYADIWHGSKFYEAHGTTACRLLDAEKSITNEGDVNGARYRVNALLFALHYIARVEGMGVKANRETATLKDMMKESSRSRSQINALLQRGRWYALWVSELGLGAILALGDSIAWHNNAQDLGQLVKVCKVMPGFRQRSQQLFKYARKAIEEAIFLSDGAQDRNKASGKPQSCIDYPRTAAMPSDDRLGCDTGELTAYQDRVHDKQPGEAAQDTRQSLGQPSSVASGARPQPGIQPGSTPLQTLAEVAQTELREGPFLQVPSHDQLEDVSRQLPSNGMATNQRMCGQSMLPQWPPNIGSSWPQETAASDSLPNAFPTRPLGDSGRPETTTGGNAAAFTSDIADLWPASWWDEMLTCETVEREI